MCDLQGLMSPSGFYVTKILPTCWVVWLYMCVYERINQDNKLSDSSIRRRQGMLSLTGGSDTAQ